MCVLIATLAGRAWFVRYPRNTNNIRLSGITNALVRPIHLRPAAIEANEHDESVCQVAVTQSKSAFDARLANNASSLKGNVMDKNRVEGAAKQVTGSIKETFGKVTGNKTTQAEGAAERVAGKVQSKVGKAADAVRDIFRK